MARGSSDYNRSVFINCPFDDDFRPILEAILFCLVDCGLTPRIASERLDSGEVRLEKILELMRASRYSIHDLSRVRASEEGQYSRLNMSFELGIDYGLSRAGQGQLANKRLLVVAEDPYTYRAALSDIAGWDVRAHSAALDKAIRGVRSWLASMELTDQAASEIVGDYVGFQEWDYERLLADGWEEVDIRERPTSELLRAMHAWIDAGRPMTL